MSRYPVPASRASVEQTISRSRFVATAAMATNPDMARAFVAEVRASGPSATHHCYAFVCGPPGSTAQVGMSDDGEPAGTAGRPMLAVLLGSGVGDIVVVVARFYGGIKLGTGGLVRAYSGSVKEVLAALRVQDKLEFTGLVLTAPYRSVSLVERLLPQYEARILSQEFTEMVTWRLQVPVDRVDDLKSALSEWGHALTYAAG